MEPRRLPGEPLAMSWVQKSWGDLLAYRPAKDLTSVVSVYVLALVG
jgi:hypothetical protein